MSDAIIRNLNCRVVEYTSYDEKVVQIENISYDLARVLTDLMNEKLDSYFGIEDMDDE